MTRDEVVAILKAMNFEVAAEKPIPHGTQLRFTNGALVSVFDTGKISVQGKKIEEVQAALDQKAAGAAQIGADPRAAPSNNVFVVYGHDEKTRAQLDAMLRRWGLEPLILDQLPSEGQTIIEKLEKYTEMARFGVVLATPDDEGFRRDHPDEKAYRARQNVVLELGMLLAKLGRSKVAVLLQQQDQMERPSDIQGLIYIPFKDNLEKESGILLAKELSAAGYQIEVSKL